MELVLEILMEGIAELLTSCVPKRIREKRGNKYKIILVLWSIICVVIAAAAVIGIVSLIEWKWPTLLDIVHFD